MKACGGSGARRGIVAFTLLALAAVVPGLAHADRGFRHGDRGFRHGRERGGPRWHGDIRHFDRHDRGIWRGGFWRHGDHGGRFGWWWVVGGSWYLYPQPVYPYPNPYVPPVVVQQPPVQYIERPQAGMGSPSAPAPDTWYHCAHPTGYYPYVRECPGGWTPVPATPPQ